MINASEANQMPCFNPPDIAANQMPSFNPPDITANQMPPFKPPDLTANQMPSYNNRQQSNHTMLIMAGGRGNGKKNSGGHGVKVQGRFKCDYCEKSFTLQTNKNRHMRKVHPDYQSRPSNHANKMAALPGNENGAENCQAPIVKAKKKKQHSGPPKIIVNVFAPPNPDDAPITPTSNPSPPVNDNSHLIAALNNNPPSPPKQNRVLSDILAAIHQSPNPPPPIHTNSYGPTNENLSPVSAPNEIQFSANSMLPANQNEPFDEMTNENMVTIEPANQNTCGISAANEGSPTSSTSVLTSTSNETSSSIAISDNSYVDSGLGTPSPPFKPTRGGGRGRGRRSTHIAYDPTSCGSPGQSSDGSVDGATFPTRLDKGRYICGICDASFTFQTNLTRHQRKLHGKPYVRNPRANQNRESPENLDSRSPVSHHIEIKYEVPFSTPVSSGGHAPSDNLVHNPGQHEGIPSPEGLPPMESPHLMPVHKVEHPDGTGSPVQQQQPEIPYETHTLPYSAL